MVHPRLDSGGRSHNPATLHVLGPSWGVVTPSAGCRCRTRRPHQSWQMNALRGIKFACWQETHDPQEVKAWGGGGLREAMTSSTSALDMFCTAEHR
jgi:hypothetical protein